MEFIKKEIYTAKTEKDWLKEWARQLISVEGTQLYKIETNSQTNENEEIILNNYDEYIEEQFSSTSNYPVLYFKFNNLIENSSIKLRLYRPEPLSTGMRVHTYSDYFDYYTGIYRIQCLNTKNTWYNLFDALQTNTLNFTTNYEDYLTGGTVAYNANYDRYSNIAYMKNSLGNYVIIFFGNKVKIGNNFNFSNSLEIFKDDDGNLFYCPNGNNKTLSGNTIAASNGFYNLDLDPPLNCYKIYNIVGNYDLENINKIDVSTNKLRIFNCPNSDTKKLTTSTLTGLFNVNINIPKYSNVTINSKNYFSIGENLLID